MKVNFVWLLWGSDAEDRWVKGVYVDKVKAEADLRVLQNADDGRGYIYRLQETAVTHE